MRLLNATLKDFENMNFTIGGFSGKSLALLWRGL